MGQTQHSSSFRFLLLLFLLSAAAAAAAGYDGPLYDFTAYTQCKARPEHPLYNGGILQHRSTSSSSSHFIMLQNLTQNTYYSFSGWVKINEKTNSNVPIKAVLASDTPESSSSYQCIGTVIAQSRCWSFLKGGFHLASPPSSLISNITFQCNFQSNVTIKAASVSLQPFTDKEWMFNQQYMINKVRKRSVTIHVSDSEGHVIHGANIKVQQTSKDFLFGSAISKTIIENPPYQKWFAKRFNAAVFENELKWYATEAVRGVLNYTLADQMMKFVRKNKIVIRGHNIFWDDPKYNPVWVRNLTKHELQSAVTNRMLSLIKKFKDEFIHWDVNNELLHFDFFEERLGPNATLKFFEALREGDPRATLFMNDFNVVETCSDVNSTVDAYIAKIKEFKTHGVPMVGIGLEGHYNVPNIPLTRAVIDKFATLKLPIWLTEVDISHEIDNVTQGEYLEEVLRDVYAHPGVNGMMMWTAMHAYGCYEMCLTDRNFRNLPTGDVVDKLVDEWETGVVEGVSDEHGSYSFFGFLGEHRVTVVYESVARSLTFDLGRGGTHEARHVYIVL